ncbi:hypothetical protein [Brevundimonas sp. SL130]|uniref:hypothetical protein n=1 Tax=Brevundimonas sp. SL130 TaxID=2995143 RepID=UPI00226CC731|nr:hypothetical protein [Brevundimonas sp. SL130]WAC61336.1 hypothetical protein OU998_07825 [Brevundimonas sp. SL130]
MGLVQRCRTAMDLLEAEETEEVAEAIDGVVADLLRERATTYSEGAAILDLIARGLEMDGQPRLDALDLKALRNISAWMKTQVQ